MKESKATSSMMRKMILVISIVLVVAGCSKEENIAIDYNEYITVADEYVMFQNVVNENLKWVYRLKMHPDVEDENAYRRVYVTKDTTIGDSAVYTLDYGKARNDYDRVHKDSTIRVTVAGDMTDEGDKAYVSLDGFKIKNYIFHGKLVFKHTGTDADTKLLNLATKNLKCSDTTGGTHSLDMNQQFRLELLSSAPDNLALRFSADGEVQGNAGNSKDYSVAVTDTSVIRDSLACTRIQSGSVKLDLINTEEDLTYIDFNLSPADSCGLNYLINIDDNKYETERPQIKP